MNAVEDAAVAAAQQLASSCKDPLGTALVSVILHGSLTMGDFQPGRSDLDLLLVVERGLTPAEADALVEMVRAADPSPAGGVDVLVVTRPTAERPADYPSRELLVGRWPSTGGELEVEGHDEHVPDLWPELSEARAKGRSLLGPKPAEVIGEVPLDRIRANGMGWLRTWLDRTDDERNAAHMVLTACRIWRFESTGEHVSKSEAARWALERDPTLTGVELALAARTSFDQPAIDPGEIERVLRRVLRDFGEVAAD